MASKALAIIAGVGPGTVRSISSPLAPYKAELADEKNRAPQLPGNLQSLTLL